MENNLTERIKTEYKSLSKTHRIIADLYLKGLVTRENTLIDVATMGYCSHSTVLRFIRQLGYQNFKVFMDDYFNSRDKSSTTISYSFTIVDEYISNNEAVLKQFIRDINHSSSVYIFASGMSYLPAYNLFYKGNMIVNKFILLKDLDDHKIDFEKDLVIFLSNSGNSRKLKVMSSSIKDFYLISNYSDTNLSKSSLQTLCLGNHIESHSMMDTQPRESIYSLIYFTDKIFELLQNSHNDNKL